MKSSCSRVRIPSPFWPAERARPGALVVSFVSTALISLNASGKRMVYRAPVGYWKPFPDIGLAL